MKTSLVTGSLGGNVFRVRIKLVVDNDTTTYFVHWDDREANGGDGGGDIDAAELTILAQLTEADAHGAGYQATGDFLLY